LIFPVGFYITAIDFPAARRRREEEEEQEKEEALIKYRLKNYRSKQIFSYTDRY
jgi:hypothetical protein